MKLYYCPVCMHVPLENDETDKFTRKGSEYFCNFHLIDGKNSFTLEDYAKLKRCKFNEEGVSTLFTYIHNFSKRGDSIRKISDAMHLKKSFVGQILKKISVETTESSLGLFNKKHYNLIFSTYQSFLNLVFDYKTPKNEISVITKLTQIGCSSRLIYGVLSKKIKYSNMSLYAVRQQMKKVEIAFSGTIYQTNAKTQILIHADIILNYLLTYHVRQPAENWKNDFFEDELKILKYLKECDIYITNLHLRTVWKEFSLESDTMDLFSRYIFSHQDNFFYKFKNGYKLTVYFEENTGALIDLNKICKPTSVTA